MHIGVIGIRSKHLAFFRQALAVCFPGRDPQNHLLMHSIGVNVSGQIASVIAGGIILNIFSYLT